MEIQANPAPVTRPEIIMIVAGNIIPLLGVLFWQWNVFELMYLYWAENVVIGIFSILALLIAGSRGGISGFAGALGMSAFFTVHYGMFCMGHGVFVLGLFNEPALHELGDGLFAAPAYVLQDGVWTGFFWALAGMGIVHAVRLFAQIPGLKEDDLGRLMFSPYGRIIVLHITLIFGGMLVMALETPVAGLLLLIVLKTAFDLGLLKFFKKETTHGSRRKRLP